MVLSLWTPEKLSLLGEFHDPFELVSGNSNTTTTKTNNNNNKIPNAFSLQYFLGFPVSYTQSPKKKKKEGSPVSFAELMLSKLNVSSQNVLFPDGARVNFIKMLF